MNSYLKGLLINEEVISEFMRVAKDIAKAKKTVNALITVIIPCES
jgi:vacuolar-type H+-ATPase subunit D/Vma8